MEEREDNQTQLDIIDILRKALKLWWVWVFTTLVGGFGGFFGRMALVDKTYEASTLLYVNNSSISSSLADFKLNISDINAAQSIVDVYSIIIKTRNCLDKVDNELVDVINGTSERQTFYDGLFSNAYGNSTIVETIRTLHPTWHTNNGEDAPFIYDYNYLKGKVTVGGVNNTEVFEVKVTTVSPFESVLLSNLIADAGTSLISSIVAGTSAKLVDPAQVAYQVSWGRAKYAVICAAIGFVVGAGIVLLFYFLDDEIKDKKYFETVYPNLPILSTIPDSKSNMKHGYSYYYKKSYYGASYGYGPKSNPQADTTEGKEEK